jgi:hypothetical protein
MFAVHYTCTWSSWSAVLHSSGTGFQRQTFPFLYHSHSYSWLTVNSLTPSRTASSCQWHLLTSPTVLSGALPITNGVVNPHARALSLPPSKPTLFNSGVDNTENTACCIAAYCLLCRILAKARLSLRVFGVGQQETPLSSMRLLLLKRLLPLVEHANLIPNHQFGFRPRHSTIKKNSSSHPRLKRRTR